VTITVFMCGLIITLAVDSILDTHLEIYAPGGKWIPVEELDISEAVYSREQVKAADELAVLTRRITWLTGITAVLVIHYTIRFLRHTRLTEYAILCSIGVRTEKVLFAAALEMFLFLTAAYILCIFTGFGTAHLLAVFEMIPFWLTISLPGEIVWCGGEGIIFLLILFHTLAIAQIFRKHTPIRILSVHQ